MYISAKADYGTRALLALAAADGTSLKGRVLAEEQGLPLKFVENILVELRRAGLVRSQRGSEGGYRLARPPGEISVADVIRALEGPLAEVRGSVPETASYEGAAEHLLDVWIAVRAALRQVLEGVSLAQIVDDDLPDVVRALIANPDAWTVRTPNSARTGDGQ